jgi:hypothetical protein
MSSPQQPSQSQPSPLPLTDHRAHQGDRANAKAQIPRRLLAALLLSAMPSALQPFAIPAAASTLQASAVETSTLDSWNFDPFTNQLKVRIKQGTQPRYFFQAKPARIVLELPDTNLGDVKAHEANYVGTAIKHIRLTTSETGATQIVLELAPKVKLGKPQVEFHQDSVPNQGLPPGLAQWSLRPVIVDPNQAPASVPKPAADLSAATPPAAKPAAKPAEKPAEKPAATLTQKPADPQATTPRPMASSPSPATSMGAIAPAPEALPAQAARPTGPTFVQVPPLQVAAPPLKLAVQIPPPQVPPKPLSVQPSPLLAATPAAIPAVPSPAPITIPAVPSPTPIAVPAISAPRSAPVSAPVLAPTLGIETSLAIAPDLANVKILPSTPLGAPSSSSATRSGESLPLPPQAKLSPSLAAVPAPEANALPAIPESPAPTQPLGKGDRLNTWPTTTWPAPTPVPAAASIPVIDFGQPLPLAPSASTPSASTPSASTPSASVPVPEYPATAPVQPVGMMPGGAIPGVPNTPQILTANPGMLGPGSLGAGSLVNLRYPGVAPLVLNPNADSEVVALVVDSSVQDSSGQVLLPKGSVVYGQFQGTRQGNRFVAQSVSWDGRSRPMVAESDLLDGPRRVSQDKLLTYSGIGAVAVGVMGDFSGESLVGGAAVGAAASYLTAPRAATLQPGQVISIRLQVDWR